MWPFLFSFAVSYAIKNDEANHNRLKLNSMFQFLIYSEGFILLGNKNTKNYKNVEFLLVANKQISLRPNAEKIKYMLMPVVAK